MRRKPDHYYTQSAVIPFRREGGEVRLLLITSRRGRRWVIPKGIVEPDLSPADSAAKEALEEAGVTGRVEAAPLGVYTYAKWGGVCTVAVYLMAVDEVLDAWPESFRQRVWLTVTEAAERVEEPDLKHLLRRVPVVLASR